MISIVTPSYNQLQYLKRCCASVADQSEPHEHIVVDGGSTDGTVEWLKGQDGVRWISEPDHGMYDAINKGFAMASGSFVAYLNCDEQYLPGALSEVKQAFDGHPEVGIVFGDALLINPDGALVAFRKTYPLRWSYVATSHLYVLSCTTFFRKTLLGQCGVYNTFWRDVGDADLILRALCAGARSLRIPIYLSVFTISDENRSAGSLAKSERRQLAERNSVWLHTVRFLINAVRLTEKALRGAYCQAWPLSYSIYQGSRSERTQFVARSGTFRWRR